MKTIKLLRDKCSNLLVCYDNDDAGQNAMQKFADYFGVHSVQLPDDVNDVADFFQKNTDSDFQQLITKALRLGQQQLVARDETTEKGRSIFQPGRRISKR